MVGWISSGSGLLLELLTELMTTSLKINIGSFENPLLTNALVALQVLRKKTLVWTHRLVDLLCFFFNNMVYIIRADDADKVFSAI